MSAISASSQPASITVRGLTKRYGDNAVVRNLSLDVEEGELLVLLGPSGCGKTTTMRCIMGLEKAEEGIIRIGDREVFNASTNVNVRSNDRGAGMVFQSYAIWPHMTVFQNVSFPLKMQKVSRGETKDRTEEVLELVGLSGLGSRPASKLSGGQMQRVALARSVVMRPSILCLDEPLSNLDAKLRDRLRFEIRQLQQTLKITTVYVTHDQSEALALADRLVVLRSGEIAQAAEPVTLYRQPVSTYVADFMGVSNILGGTVESADGPGVRVHVDGSDLRLSSDAELSVGSRVDVCLRPEAAHIAATASGAVNEFAARVKVATFLGAQTRYRVSLSDGLGLWVTANTLDDPHRADDEVFVSFPPRQVQLIPRTEDGELAGSGTRP